MGFQDSIYAPLKLLKFIKTILYIILQMLKHSLLFPLKIAVGVAMLLTLLPSSAKAAIVWNESSGVLEADNFWYNPIERSTSIMGFNEEQGVNLDQAIPIQTLNEWDNWNPSNPNDTEFISYLEPGLVVDSHMLYFTNPDPSKGSIPAEATIKFTGKILGLIGDSRLFYSNEGRYDRQFGYSFDSNYLFAPNAANNPAVSLWTLEEELSWTPLDSVEYLSEDTLYLNWSSRSAVDPLRVLTVSSIQNQPVPEPLTILGAGSAIAMGGFFKSKLKNKVKDT